MFRDKSLFPSPKRGRPKIENPRKARKVCMTEQEWNSLLVRCAQFDTKPGETIGILAAFK
jgi:hypothetical protein